MYSMTPGGNPMLAVARGQRLVPLHSVLRTDLHCETSRPPDYEGDARAEETLAQVLGDSPQTGLRSLAGLVLERLQAGSAGVSVLNDDRTSFRWGAVAGRWEAHVGYRTPRDLGPCGDALDRDAYVAFVRPDRRYTYLASLSPEPAEFLVVPFHAHGRAIGALWAVLHEESGTRGRFDAEDLRRLVRLSKFASVGHELTRLCERLDDHAGAASGPSDRQEEVNSTVGRDASARRRAALNLLEDAVHAHQAAAALNQELRESEAQLAIELAAAQQLQSASALLSEPGNSDALYQKLVDASMVIMQSDMGNLQMVDEAHGALRLLAWRGFSDSFGERFALTQPDAETACSRAWQQGHRVVVPDLEACDFIVGTTARQLRAEGIRAVQSTPLFSRGGRLVGVLSTHWRAPHEPSETKLRSLDILARQAADLIERKTSEEAVGRLAAIVASSGDAIIGQDLHGIITSWNSGAEQLFGYANDEAVGKSASMLIPASRADEEQEVLQRIHDGEKVEPYETVRLRKGGRLLDVSITLSPVRDAQGRIMGAAKIARDVSERIHNEEALRDADRRKNEFLAVLAHELRGPLTPILNGLQILRLGGADPAARASTEAMMERQVHHMARLIDDLIDINRISRGKLGLHRQPVVLTTTVKNVVEAVRPAFEGRRHELIVTLPSRPVYVSADPTRLAQVIGNLLHNAMKFTDSGGRIDLTVEREEKRVAVRIRDTGIGISTENQALVFDMFSQVDHSLERSQGGLGIGLSLVKRIVEMHDGVISVHSAGPGQGSEFTVHLPTLDEQTLLPIDEPSPERLASGKRRILVVDDNADSADSLAKLLELRGHDVRIARDGLEAVELAASFCPELVLLDLGLPRLNGFEAARRIRNQPSSRRAALIAVSGWGQEEDRRRSQEAGFDLHLVKPLDPAALDRMIATIVPH